MHTTSPSTADAHASESAATAGEHATESDRYELEDLFASEGTETRHFLKMVGIVILVVLLLAALAFPLKFL
jgi:hypothetical protein